MEHGVVYLDEVADVHSHVAPGDAHGIVIVFQRKKDATRIPAAWQESMTKDTADKDGI